MRWLVSITDSTGHEFEQTLGDSEKQWSLAGCSPWGCKQQDTILQLTLSLILSFP